MNSHSSFAKWSFLAAKRGRIASGLAFTLLIENGAHHSQFNNTKSKAETQAPAQEFIKKNMVSPPACGRGWERAVGD
jgi:hypothetical protein